ncbi:MAG: D-glycero-beta-D-manno-heptose 1-phosphate adenylyltransferase [Rhodospirillaceae bacterium]|nr:D-glycero-beta-D-manno-heptose 1-phosphate adenylyltransferase [Rhodospirillaceae bacterium]
MVGFAGRRVLCVGDVMEDRSIFGEVRRISPEAPVPVLRIVRETRDLGGAGNVVRNLVALGAAPALVAVIGEDRAGREVIEMLAAMATVEPFIRVARGRETTIKNRFFSLDGHHLLRADRETVTALDPADEDDLARAAVEQVPGCDAVMLSDYRKGVFNGTLAARIIAAARAHNKPVIVDPKGSDYGRYRGADVITPNRQELAEATGLAVDTVPQLVDAARTLCAEIGAGAVLVTRSGEGMSVVVRDGLVVHLPAETREVADVTGAGDTVAATLAVALAAGVPLIDGARIANTAAGVVVARRGTAVATAHDIGAALLHRDLALAEQKFTDLAGAARKAEDWRARGLKVGFTNGCFDLLHPGHVALLAQARAACDRLIVGLNSDASVRRLKGEGRPVQGAAARAAVMASLASVDLVLIFDGDTPIDEITALRPDVLVKGADYSRATVVGADVVESYGGRVLLADLVPSFSTTATIAALKRAQGQ